MMRERAAALDTRDPLAIRRAGDRYKVVADALGRLDPGSEVDPSTYMIGMKEAAKALGISVREARVMARERKLPVRFAGNDLRVPLAAIL
jgi:hypothetical protein